MSTHAVKGQTADRKIQNLLVTLGLKVDDAVSQAISALIGSGSHSATGIGDAAAAIQEQARVLDQAILCTLERNCLCKSPFGGRVCKEVARQNRN